MPFTPQVALIRARDGLYRMPLHSLWNNSWRLYDYCAFARLREGVIFHSASARLKLSLSKTSNARTPKVFASRRPTSNEIAGGGARTHTALRPLDFESSASASSATPATRKNGTILPSCKSSSGAKKTGLAAPPCVPLPSVVTHRGGGVGRVLGVTFGRGAGVGVSIGVAVGVVVAVAVAVAAGVVLGVVVGVAVGVGVGS